MCLDEAMRINCKQCTCLKLFFTGLVFGHSIFCMEGLKNDSNGWNTFS